MASATDTLIQETLKVTSAETTARFQASSDLWVEYTSILRRGVSGKITRNDPGRLAELCKALAICEQDLRLDSMLVNDALTATALHAELPKREAEKIELFKQTEAMVERHKKELAEAQAKSSAAYYRHGDALNAKNILTELQRRSPRLFTPIVNGGDIPQLVSANGKG